MKPNRSVPPATVVPVVSYPDVRAAVAWLSAAFGFVERTRIGESHRAQMSIGADGAVIVAERRGEEPAQDGGVTHLIRVRVEDVSAQFGRARAHGAACSNRPQIGSTASGTAPWRMWRAIDGSSPRPCGTWPPRITAARPSRPGPAVLAPDGFTDPAAQYGRLDRRLRPCRICRSGFTGRGRACRGPAAPSQSLIQLHQRNRALSPPISSMSRCPLVPLSGRIARGVNCRYADECRRPGVHSWPQCQQRERGGAGRQA